MPFFVDSLQGTHCAFVCTFVHCRADNPSRVRRIPYPVDFERWKYKTVFKDPATCIGNLRQNAVNGRVGLTLPRISEEGRLFLANLLQQFIADRSRVVAMFALAHMEMADPVHTADDWADVFISKAQEISNHSPCPQIVANSVRHLLNTIGDVGLGVLDREA